MFEFIRILEKLLERKDLDEEEVAFALEKIMFGEVNNAQISAFLTALEIKRESVPELIAFVKTMRRNAVTIAPRVRNLVDTAGTGGDNSSTFNISTCAAFVAAGCGASVAKHGNRAVSSKSGSADVLEELKVKIDLNPEIVQSQIEKIGIGFLFAPLFHPAMKNIAMVRKELGFKTVFNMLGPLTNPAGAKRQLIGVYDSKVLDTLVEVMKILGTEKTLIVSSDIDELSVSEDTHVLEIAGGDVKKYTLCPEEFGFKRVSIDQIRVNCKEESAKLILDILDGKNSESARDVILLNAGAAAYASGLAASIKSGITLAEKSIDSGKALEKLELLRTFESGGVDGGHS